MIIKLFEQFNSYEKITLEEFEDISVLFYNYDIDISEYKKPVDFTNKEFDIIKNLFYHRGSYIDITYGSGLISGDLSEDNVNKSIIVISVGEESRGKYNIVRFAINIYKVSDEYYYIMDYINDNQYKCDQFDGLLNCLKSIKCFII